MKRWILCSAIFISLIAAQLSAQSADRASQSTDEELRFVVYLSRHGVRSPTGKPEQYNIYSSAPWPAWNVPPGYLTAHGYRLMQIFGAYDRKQLADEGLFEETGCKDASRATIYADSDQRTRETARALAAGLFPGCSVALHGLPEGTPDPLFHRRDAGAASADSALALAAISGRIGGDPNNLTAINHARLVELDTILAKCGAPGTTAGNRISILEIPAALIKGKSDHAAELRGPVTTASTITENLLLEYTEGMDASNVGWGCVNGDNLRSLLDLHTAASDFAQRTTPIAQLQASNLLDHIRRALQQAATGEPVAGAISRPDDQALFLIGHDTNLSNVAGLLNLTWIADGRRDDTPPGSALVFELWHSRSSKEDFVRTYYTAQTIEQMRTETTLSANNQPVRVRLFVPGCGNGTLSCTWPSFAQTINQAINPRDVSPK
jgi:4-phytase/acid phosphatase